MATFKVGDRVKRVRVIAECVPLGSTGTVIRGNYQGVLNNECCDVQWDHNAPHAGYFVSTLAPLTDPGAQKVIDTANRFARERPGHRIWEVIGETAFGEPA